MALCSTAFNNKSIKRSCASIDTNTPNTNNKRICFKNFKFPGGRGDAIDATGATTVPLDKNGGGADSSSDDDENSDDENLNYRLHQIRAKRRASSRISFSLNPNLELSKYISKYSDEDEEDHNDGNHSRNGNQDHQRHYQHSHHHSSSRQIDDDEELVTRRGGLADGKSINLCQDLEQELLNLTKKQSNHSRSNSFDDFKLIQVPRSDHMARARCFDYLVGSIDEAWARYCDATSCIEDEVFYSDGNSNKYMTGPKPSKTNVDDSDYEQGSNHPHNNDDDDIIDNYSVNSTDLTDISDNYLSVKCRGNSTNNTVQRPSYLSLTSSGYSDTTSKPSNTNQYQKLKDRLTKAKYYLQDLIDSDDYQDIQNFWNRWDMIKYVTIELVEDDDDSDEVLESTIEELEAGRYYVN